MKLLSIRAMLAAAVFSLFLMLLWKVPSVSAQTPAQVPAQTPEPAQPEVVFNHIAVAPFLIVERRPDVNQVQDVPLTCSISMLCVRAPALLTDAGPTLTRLTHTRLRERFSPFNIIPLLQARAVFDEIMAEGRGQDTPLSLARKMGAALDAEFVLVGMVWRYRERGSVDVVPDSPASVAFSLYLIQARDGLLIWRGLYEATQEPVSENLFEAGKRLKMGLQWLTVHELADHGMKQAFKTFPGNLRPVGGTFPPDSESP